MDQAIWCTLSRAMRTIVCIARPIFLKHYEHVEPRWGDARARKLFIDNPAAVINDAPIVQARAAEVPINWFLVRSQMIASRSIARAEEMSMTRFVSTNRYACRYFARRFGSGRVRDTASPCRDRRPTTTERPRRLAIVLPGLQPSSDYMLGPGDLISVFVGELEERV